MPATNTARQAAPIGAGDDRAIDDRLAEVIRRHHHGLIRPLWQDLPNYKRAQWRETVPAFLTMLESVGLEVRIRDDAKGSDAR